ncbi:MAG TPA: SAM-dependent methyltransferase [Pseudonocardiaceae bacterium]|nr:SAM-dependent methyltransferase [Pseudonocardiaceae bacterium]
MSGSSSQTPDAPEGVNLEQASAARIYDAYLGGTTNWAVDQMFADQAVREFPLIKPLARANRRFLGRVVREALDAGITQFLDLGSGVPTVGNVHAAVAAHELADQGRVVYVDNEPVAVAHSELILDREQTTDWVGVVKADLRDRDAVLHSSEVRRLLDFTKPVCLLIVSVLHFIGGETDVAEVLRQYRAKLAPGSWLALSHICNEDSEPEGAAQIARLAEKYRNTQNPAFLRDRTEISSWFGDFTIVDPGIVHLADWRPNHQITPEEREAGPFMWCGVGQKPARRK